MLASISVVDDHFNPLTILQNYMSRTIDISVVCILTHSHSGEQSRCLLSAVNCVVESTTVGAIIAEKTVMNGI